MENKKQIPGYEGLYHCNSSGEVFSIDRVVEYSNGLIVKHKGRKLRQEKSKGYLRVSLSKDNKVKRFLVHRLVACCFIDNVDDKKEKLPVTFQYYASLDDDGVIAIYRVVEKVEDGTPNTAHTLNPVPLFVIDRSWKGTVKAGKLGDIAPSILTIMGLPVPKEMTGDVLIDQ